MTVYLVLREDQSDHGFVDTTVLSVFRSERAAEERATAEKREARNLGLRVADDDCADGEWQVSVAVEAHSLV